MTAPIDLGAGTPGRDLVVVDGKNKVWRWRPKDTAGNGTTTLIPVSGVPSSAKPSAKRVGAFQNAAVPR